MRSFTVTLALAALVPATARAATYDYVTEGHPLLYFKGTTTPPVGWVEPGGSEASFTASSAGFGIGYGDGDDRTVLDDMSGSYLTVYVRAHFTVGAERSALTPGSTS